MLRFAIGALGVLGLVAALPLVVHNEYWFFAGYVVLQLIVLATAWNILGGYAGYVNFGTGAFFAVGAYTAVALYKAFALPLGLQILAGAAASGLLGFGVGMLTLRLRGIFFSIATIAVAIVLETVVLNWHYVGGAKGLPILRPAETPFFGSYTVWLFFVMTVIAVIAVGAARYVETSWIGRGLRAIRDNEGAAECSGVPTLKLKLAAATLSGALMGAAGAPYAQYLSFIEPTSSFSLNHAVNALAMPIIGGMGHWMGPVIGAVLLGTLQQVVTVTVSSEVNVLVVGVMLVVFVVAAPEGILGLVKRWKKASSK
ncbi:MAG TPA: branched-chain amino acid ABC transporter permease [Burkholderiales bacterium]|jgi:branched-chain amino acid transport system permease protein